MKSAINFKISLEENSSKGKAILAWQSAISYAKALAQVQNGFALLSAQGDSAAFVHLCL